MSSCFSQQATSADLTLVLRMSSLNTHYAGRSRVGSQTLTAPATAGNRGTASRLTSTGLPQQSANDRIRVTKRKASAEFTPSAPNGQPLRHAKSAATLLQTGIGPNYGMSCDAEDSPRIKRMRVDRTAATNERNGGESGAIAKRLSHMLRLVILHHQPLLAHESRAVPG